MIKAGEAGGALEVILRRLAEFQERAQSLKRKVKGAMIYPIVVITVAVGILTFIMIKIVPAFEKIFKDFKTDLPTITMHAHQYLARGVRLLVPDPAHPHLRSGCSSSCCASSTTAASGWDLFTLKVPIFGQLVEKNILARTTRTLGTLVSSGVPILGGPEHHARNLRQRDVRAAVRQGQRIHPRRRKHRQAAEGIFEGELQRDRRCCSGSCSVGGPIGLLMYVLRMNQRIVDDLVVNMVDVGEETGELDTMLYKVADTYDEEVAVLTESLVKPDGAVVDHLPGRGGRVHRGRAVHAAGHADHQPHRRQRRGEAITKSTKD